MSDIQRFLKDKYYDPSFAGSYAGLDKFYREIVKHKPEITKATVRNFLLAQDSFTLHRKIIKSFKRNKAHYTRPNEYWYMDLKDMNAFVSSNNGYKYVLVVIDGFSRTIYARPLRSKDAKEVGEALLDILSESKQQPLVLMSDAGGEMVNRYMKKLTGDRGIKQ